MTIDLNELSTRELDALITKAKKRKTTLKKRKPAASVRARLRAAAKAEGYTIDELFGATSVASKAGKAGKSTKGRKLGKVAPKYRNPANKSETWTGRGKPPRWMAPLLEKGKKPEDFLIEKPTATKPARKKAARRKKVAKKKAAK
ncbi:H-NS histone family protein [Luteimonas vadosa]|uniref:H-NS family nucleoid-associated regulatory protein n=1 Tax=Luteimonas vadosa TaxID=1165507 RepID=A0ABP9DMY4_9GAMM